MFPSKTSPSLCTLRSSSPLVPTLKASCAKGSDFTAAFDIFISLLCVSLSVSPLLLCVCLPICLSRFLHWEWYDGILQEESPNGVVAFIALPLDSYSHTYMHIRPQLLFLLLFDARTVWLTGTSVGAVIQCVYTHMPTHTYRRYCSTT